MLSVAPSSLLLAILVDFDRRYHIGLTGYQAVAAFLSLPVGGLLNGLMMRGLLWRPALWRALTAGGLVIARSAVAALIFGARPLWWMTTAIIANWLAKFLGLAAPPSWDLRVASVALLFGLLLGSVQAFSLEVEWRRRLLWSGLSAVAAVPAVFCIYARKEIEPMEALPKQMAFAAPLTGNGDLFPFSWDWQRLQHFSSRCRPGSSCTGSRAAIGAPMPRRWSGGSSSLPQKSRLPFGVDALCRMKCCR